MLQINNLSLIHRKDLRVILEDFSMVLNPGDKAVIIGEEGNGKSTLLKWIADPHLVEEYMEASGLRILGTHRIGYLPQELPDSEKSKTIYEFFSEMDSFWEQAPRDLSDLARRFQLQPEFFYSDQLMGSLSGGEKVKSELMKLLINSPDVLMLDEPSNDIDIQTLELLEVLINDWKGIVLYISHDETLIENTANMVIHLEQIMRKMKSRYTVARLPYRTYVEERLQKFEKQEQMAMNDRREKAIRDEKLRRLEEGVASKLDNIAKKDRDAAGRLLKKKMKAVKSMGKRFDREDENMTEKPEKEEAIDFKLGESAFPIPAGKKVIEFELDQLKAPGQDRLLSENIHLSLYGSEKVCIIGNNGAGKTTLIKQIAHELLERKDIHAEYMPQNYEELLNPDQCPVDFLDQSGHKNERTKIRTYLGALKFTPDEMLHQIRELSGGQKAKLFLMKMNLSGANVLVLDEPTRNFSPLSGPVLRELIRDFPGAVISISHDRKYIHEVCDRIYRLTPTGLFPEDNP